MILHIRRIAADALGCDITAVDLQIGDTDLPTASVAGGSSGISSWGRAIVAAARAFRDEHGDTRPQAPPHQPMRPTTMKSTISECIRLERISSKHG